MKKNIYETKTITQQVVVDKKIICDICKQEIKNGETIVLKA